MYLKDTKCEITINYDRTYHFTQNMLKKRIYDYKTEYSKTKRYFSHDLVFFFFNQLKN